MAERTVQLAIIGGGPAGLVTALTATQEGVKSILLVEKKRAWGEPVQCAEYVPKLITQMVEIPPDAVANRITDITFFLDGEEIGRVRSPGFILHREIFEKVLAKQAERLGVEYLQPATVLEVGGHELHIRLGSETKTVHAKIIVGADGPRSIVRRRIDPAPPILAGAVQWVLPLSRPSETAEVHFSPAYGAGYAWVFPKGNVANIGLALDSEKKSELKGHFDGFIRRIRKVGKISSLQPTRKTGGLIPINGPAQKTVNENMLLVGDAAGQTNPLTGAGIYTAAACGQFAGRAIAGALREQDISFLQEYGRNWRDLLGRFLSDALTARIHLAAASPQNYADILQSAWRIKQRR
ncbi:MAG: NAD(P)/FAD-dependent oxidoreductase [Planctomycetes bacterium]|nr:NAD(P)/FAD-dependent oxidoreductase [Planctomycetota bacterium]